MLSKGGTNFVVGAKTMPTIETIACATLGLLVPALLAAVALEPIAPTAVARVDAPAATAAHAVATRRHA